MSPIERVMAAVHHEESDRIPVFPLAWDAAARHIGVSFEEYAKKPKIMAKGQIEFQKYYGFDAVSVGTDVYYLAEGFGSKIKFQENAVTLEKPALSKLEDIETLEIPDPQSDGRMPIVLECIEILRDELPDVPIIAIGGQATWACALQIVGFDKFILEAAKVVKGHSDAQPELVHKVLEITTKAYIKWQKAQIDAGVHIARLADSSASLNVVSPEIYKELIHPYHKKIVDELRNYAPDIHIAKHTCGDNMKVIELWAKEGVNWADIDYQMDIGIVKEKIGTRVCVYGNLDPVGVMLEGSPEFVMRKARECIRKAGMGGGFILGTGCVIPYTTPPENLKAMVDAARKFGTYSK